MRLRPKSFFLFLVITAKGGSFHIFHLCPELAWRISCFRPEKLAEIELIREPHLFGNFRHSQVGIDQKVFCMEYQDIIPVLNRCATVAFMEMIYSSMHMYAAPFNVLRDIHQGN